MADETEAIGIISALNEAGLLGTAPAGSGAAGVISALRDAGLLVTGGAAAGGEPRLALALLPRRLRACRRSRSVTSTISWTSSK